jgi:hypothetical protein
LEENRMDLKDAKLGDQYRIFVNSSHELIDKPSRYTMLATVIATKKPSLGNGIILAWKKNEERPDNVSPRSTPSTENDYVLNQNLYTHGKSVKRDLLVASKIINGMDGFPCKRCHNYYEFAVPNQDDGTLVCWSCRHTWQ